MLTPKYAAHRAARKKDGTRRPRKTKDKVCREQPTPKAIAYNDGCTHPSGPTNGWAWGNTLLAAAVAALDFFLWVWRVITPWTVALPPAHCQHCQLEVTDIMTMTTPHTEHTREVLLNTLHDHIMALGVVSTAIVRAELDGLAEPVARVEQLAVELLRHARSLK